MFEILATIFGLIQGALVMFNKRSNWIFYVLQMIALVIFSWQASLYGDFIINLGYIILGVVSYITWSRTSFSKVSMLNRKEGIGFSLLTIGLIAGFFFILKNTDDPLPLIDTITTSLSIVATIMMGMHKLESWIVWFVDDIIYCMQYFSLPDEAWWLFGLNIIWTGMAVGSYINWYKIYKSQK